MNRIIGWALALYAVGIVIGSLPTFGAGLIPGIAFAVIAGIFSHCLYSVINEELGMIRTIAHAVAEAKWAKDFQIKKCTLDSMYDLRVNQEVDRRVRIALEAMDKEMNRGKEKRSKEN